MEEVVGEIVIKDHEIHDFHEASACVNLWWFAWGLCHADQLTNHTSWQCQIETYLSACVRVRVVCLMVSPIPHVLPLHWQLANLTGILVAAILVAASSRATTHKFVEALLPWVFRMISHDVP